jgi:hypothetical protein
MWYPRTQQKLLPGGPHRAYKDKGIWSAATPVDPTMVTVLNRPSPFAHRPSAMNRSAIVMAVVEIPSDLYNFLWNSGYENAQTPCIAAHNLRGPPHMFIPNSFTYRATKLGVCHYD